MSNTKVTLEGNSYVVWNGDDELISVCRSELGDQVAKKVADFYARGYEHGYAHGEIDGETNSI